MPKFSQNKNLPYSAKQIHDLVMDIEKYPEFLPWCKQTKIVEHISNHELTADLLVSFKGMFEKYRSQVCYGYEAAQGLEAEGESKGKSFYFVNTKAIQGPFKNLFSSWKIFEIDENSCHVEFFLDFQFNSFLLEKMIGGVFEKAALKMMESFEVRAQQQFG